MKALRDAELDLSEAALLQARVKPGARLVPARI